MNVTDAVTVYNLEKERRAAQIEEYGQPRNWDARDDDKSGLSKKIKLALVFSGTTLATLLLVQMLII